MTQQETTDSKTYKLTRFKTFEQACTYLAENKPFFVDFTNSGSITADVKFFWRFNGTLMELKESWDFYGSIEESVDESEYWDAEKSDFSEHRGAGCCDENCF